MDNATEDSVISPSLGSAPLGPVFQPIGWTSNWEVSAGCVERYFQLDLKRKDDVRSLPRYRVQVVGFYGSLSVLHIILQTVVRAINADAERILQGIANEGRTVFTLNTKDDELARCVVVVERDPKDFTREFGILLQDEVL